jgi:hypothetical protein
MGVGSRCVIAADTETEPRPQVMTDLERHGRATTDRTARRSTATRSHRFTTHPHITTSKAAGADVHLNSAYVRFRMQGSACHRTASHRPTRPVSGARRGRESDSRAACALGIAASVICEWTRVWSRALEPPISVGLADASYAARAFGG